MTQMIREQAGHGRSRLRTRGSTPRKLALALVYCDLAPRGVSHVTCYRKNPCANAKGLTFMCQRALCPRSAYRRRMSTPVRQRGSACPMQARERRMCSVIRTRPHRAGRAPRDGTSVPLRGVSFFREVKCPSVGTLTTYPSAALRARRAANVECPPATRSVRSSMRPCATAAAAACTARRCSISTTPRSTTCIRSPRVAPTILETLFSPARVVIA